MAVGIERRRAGRQWMQTAMAARVDVRIEMSRSARVVWVFQIRTSSIRVTIRPEHDRKTRTVTTTSLILGQATSVLGLDVPTLLKLELLTAAHLHVATVELLLLVQVGRAGVSVCLARLSKAARVRVSWDSLRAGLSITALTTHRIISSSRWRRTRSRSCSAVS